RELDWYPEVAGLAKTRMPNRLAVAILLGSHCITAGPQETPVHSLYSQPATSAVRIAPSHISIIQPKGRARPTADHVACAKFSGKPAKKPTRKPIFSAVPGPGPSPGRAHAYRCATAIARINRSTVHCATKKG